MVRRVAAAPTAAGLDALTATLIHWTGSADQIEQLRAFARSYAWEEPVSDPEYAADVVISEMQADITGHPDAVARLRTALEESAERAAVATGR